MLDPQVSRFWQSTLLSGLMDVEGLTACWEAIAPAKRDALEHIDRRLARQAVQAKALTLWQAQQLLAGRTSGFRVDRYVLLDLIGQGGMGRVYLARDNRLNRRVALKILSPERVSNPRAIARFQREARVGAQLQHENLVRIYDFGESNDRHYLVMEYIEGKTIGTLISEQGAMSSVSAVRLVQQVALGLEHAHRKGLIHRDVNPYNILVTRDGTAKLADLGLAIDLADEDHVTREGATVGTFDYVAPEQARHSHSADIRSDIYSLGCTLYHMVSGQVPFPSPSLPEKLFAHQAMEPTPLGELIPGLPEGLSDVIQRMMRKLPDERYGTPIQVVQALEPFAHESPVFANIADGAQLIQHPEREVPAELLKSSHAEAPDAIRLQTEPALALAKTVSSPDTSKTSPVTPSGSNAERDANGLSRFQVSPITDYQASDLDFPVNLELAPEPYLSTGRSRSRMTLYLRSTLVPGFWRSAALVSRWRWHLGTATLLFALILVMLALVNPGSPSRSYERTKIGDTSIAEPESKPIRTAAIVVRTDGDFEQEFAPHNLLDAMQTAIGVQGWIELNNREPLHLPENQTFDFTTGQGALRIRAAPRAQPTIVIELKGSKSFLTTGSAVHLEMSGLTIIANYSGPQSAPTAGPVPTSIVTAAGAAKLEHCAFIVQNANCPRSSCALCSNGGAIAVDYCWFQGFATAIHVAAMNQSTAQIRQSMIVPGPSCDPAHVQPPEWYGWGVTLQLGSGGRVPANNPKPHLKMEHCTIDGAGLIDLTGNQGQSALQVEVKDCVVRTEAVLAYQPRKNGESFPEQIQWRGEGNQYDVLGKSWIVLSPSLGTPALSCSVIDLGTWLQLIPNESASIRAKPVFRNDQGPRSGLARPHDFALEGQGSSPNRPGANPDWVGPWGSS
jgi:serine/threonine protein kinase